MSCARASVALRRTTLTSPQAATPTQASQPSWSRHARTRTSPVKPTSVSAAAEADIAPRRVVASRTSG